MFAISPTDKNWFDFLKNHELNSFVNFWTPTPWNIKNPKTNDRWYFLLKAPIRKIGGFGELAYYKNMTISEAWNEYGLRNGCNSINNLEKQVKSYADKHSIKLENSKSDISKYEIGCLILKNCQFWEEDNYLQMEDFGITVKSQVVTRKIFNRYDPFLPNENRSAFRLLNEPRETYKSEVNLRKGQGRFKGEILKAYNNTCCVSGETCPELLEAAHIQNYLSESSNHIQNGILLKVDLHRLYDNGLLYIDGEFNIHISTLLKSTLYYELFHDKKISLPIDINDYPSISALESKLNDFRK